MIPLLLLQTALALAWYVLVGWLCLATYRHLRLATLPWIAGTYGAGLIALPATQFLIQRAFPFGADARSIAFTPAGMLVLGISSLEHLGRFLLAVLAFSEVAFLLSRAFPEFDSRLLRWLLSAHRRVRIIGIAAISVTVAGPLLAFAYVYLHGPSVPQ